MSVTATVHQPNFVADLVLAIQSALAVYNTEKEAAAKAESKDGKVVAPVIHAALAMQEPDYTTLLGTSGNLARTTLHLENKAAPIQEGSAIVLNDELLKLSPYSVHISHLGETDKESGATSYHLVFETAQGKLFPKTVTRNYVPTVQLESKLIQVAMRDQKDAVDDVIKFLTTGVAPQ